MPESRIMVIGDLMLDHFIWGDVSRISPEAPVPVVEVQRESRMPGGAANVAKNLSSLGARSAVVGLVGRDLDGNSLEEVLKEDDIGTAGLIRADNLQTTKKTRIIAHNQQVVRVDRDQTQCITAPYREQILSYIRHALHHYDAIILEDYGKGALDQGIISHTIDLCRQKGIYCAIDPKIGHDITFEGASLCTPNLHEARELARLLPEKIGELQSHGDELRSALGLDDLLITLGEDGMVLFSGNHTPFHIPTKAREVFDVSGAGDTVIATFVAAIASGATPCEAAEIANLAGGIVVGKLGTATTTIDELKLVLK